MELKDYIGALRRRWLIVVLSTLLAGLGALVFSLAATPTYQATSRVFVSTTGATSFADAQQGEMFARQRVASYVVLASGDEVARRTIEALNLNLTREELSKRVTARSAPDTVLIDISVTDSTAAGAAVLTNTLTEQLRAVVAELESAPSARDATSQIVLVSPASVPVQPIAPYTKRNVALGEAVGLLIGLIIVLVLDRFDTRVRTSKDLEDAADVEVIGVIPDWRPLRKNPALQMAGWPPANIESVRRLRLRLQLSCEHANVLVLAGAGRNVGTTTSAISLAQALANSGQRVLLIDADIHRPRITEYFGLPASPGLSSALHRTALSDAAQQTHCARLSVIGNGAGDEYGDGLLESPAFESLLAEARLTFDRVVVDAGSVVPFSEGVIVAARGDAVLLVGRYGSTKAEDFAAGESNLRSGGARLLGAILSRTPRTTSKAFRVEERVSHRSSEGDYGVKPAHFAGPSAPSGGRRGSADVDAQEAVISYRSNGNAPEVIR